MSVQTLPAGRKGRTVFWAALCAAGLCLFAGLCFWELPRAAVNSFDEARHGVNAYEMLRSGNFIVSTWGGAADLYNLKPPLSFWLIALGYRLFGYTKLGLRFYSALSFFLTGLACAGYACRRFGVQACAAALGLFCAFCPFYAAHYGRAGDADALYGLLFAGAMLCMLELPGHPRLLYLCGLCFSLAFLAKSSHALAIAATGGLFLLLTGQIRRYRPLQWVLFAVCALGPAGLWAAARWAADGDVFFRGMLMTDLLARSTSPLEHGSGPFYYLDYIFASRWVWPAAVPLLLAAGRSLPARVRPGARTLGLLLWFCVPLALFTVQRTRLYWYIIPALPGLILLASEAVQKLYDTAVGPRGRLALAGVFGLLLLPPLWVNLQLVRDENTSSLQILMEQSFTRGEAGSGTPLYCCLEDGTVDWQQGDFLTAELTGDFLPVNGGLEAFLQEPCAALLISDAAYEAQKTDTLSGCPARALGGGTYWLVTKQG